LEIPDGVFGEVGEDGVLGVLGVLGEDGEVGVLPFKSTPAHGSIRKTIAKKYTT
jgi:hypothetical protein